MEIEHGSPCGQTVSENGETFTCPGTYEVRIPAFFEFDNSSGKPELTFTALGGGEGMEGVYVSCTEYGHPAPTAHYRGLDEVVHRLENTLKEALR